jgi:TRAP-type C4-dicarboxylate transport system permease large subunit
VITNASLVAGLIVGLVFLLAGVLLWSRAHSGGAVVVTAGALLTLGAAIYALAVLRPFVGRTYDELWSEQIATVEALATIGLLICAAGMVAHVLALPKR